MLPPLSPHKAPQVWRLYFKFFFNQSTIALQCCVGSGCTTTRISYMYTYIPSLLNLRPNPYPTPIGHHRAQSRPVVPPGASHYALYTQECVHVSAALSTHPHPLLLPAPVSPCLFSTSVSLFLPCKQAHLYHLCRFLYGGFKLQFYSTCFLLLYNKLPQIQQLKAASIYCLTTLKVRCLGGFCWALPGVSHKAEIKIPTGLASHLGALGKNPPPSSCRLLTEHSSLWNYGRGCMDEVLFPCQPSAGGCPQLFTTACLPSAVVPFIFKAAVVYGVHLMLPPSLTSLLPSAKESSLHLRLLRSGPLR